MPRILGMFSKKHGLISQVSGYSAQECEMHLLTDTYQKSWFIQDKKICKGQKKENYLKLYNDTEKQQNNYNEGN